MKRQFSILLVLEICLFGSLQTLDRLKAAAVPAADSISASNQLFGFWTTADGMQTTLLVPNPTNQSHEMLLEMFDEKGQLLVSRPFQISAAASLDIPLAEVVPNSNLGYLRLSFPNQVCILPAQALVEARDRSWSYDLKDGRLLENADYQLEALLSFPDAGAKGEKEKRQSLEVKDLIVLTNLSDEKQTGELISQAGRETSRKRWSLEPGQTRLVKVKSKGHDPSDSIRVRLMPDDPRSAILATGFRSLEKDSLAPIQFRAVGPGSGEMAGFFSGADSVLQIWNFEGQDQTVELELLDEAGRITKAERQIVSGRMLEVALDELALLGPDSKGMAVVRFPAEAKLAGQIAEQGSNPRVTVMKDTSRETSLSYSLPVHLGDGRNTRLRLFNPNSVVVPVCLFLFFGEEGYTYPMKSLAPRQYVEIDLLATRESGLPGELGRTLSRTARLGQAKIVMHPAPGTEAPERKLVAMGILEDLSGRRNIAFQGCTTCPPVLTHVAFDLSNYKGFVGSDRRLRVLANFSDSGVKLIQDVTGGSQIFTLSPSIASVNQDSLRFNRAGYTQVIANVFDCTEVEVYEATGFFPILECFCSNYGSEVAQASVQSRSTRVTVHMKAFIPFNNVSAPTPEALCLWGFIPRTLVYNGNDRGFSSSLSAPHKARLIASVAASQLESSSGLISKVASTGPTHSFASDVFYNNNRIDQDEYDSRLSDCHFWHQEDQASNLGLDVTVQRLSPTKIRIVFMGSTRIPLIRLAPAIDWQATVTLDASGEKLKWELQGTHDGFPAYEFYIDGVPLYQDAPSSPAQILYLFDGAGDESFSRKGEIGI